MTEKDKDAAAPAVQLRVDIDAERARLLSMLRNGPWRRMAMDRARGLGPQRADMLQARVYRLRLEALDAGTGESDLEPGDYSEPTDTLALDRISRD